MKIIDPVIVDHKRIGNAVDRAGGVADAVRISSDDLTKMGVLVQILFRFVISQDHICQCAVFVRNPHFQPDAAKIGK